MLVLSPVPGDGDGGALWDGGGWVQRMVGAHERTDDPLDSDAANTTLRGCAGMQVDPLDALKMVSDRHPRLTWETLKACSLILRRMNFQPT